MKETDRRHSAKTPHTYFYCGNDDTEGPETTGQARGELVLGFG